MNRPALRPRHKECLEHVSNGLSSKEMARIIGISPKTVCEHIENALHILKAVNRAHAVAIAVGAGLIEPPQRRAA